MSERTRSRVVAGVALLVVALVGIVAGLLQRSAGPPSLDALARKPTAPSTSGRYVVWSDRAAGDRFSNVYLFDARSSRTRRLTDDTAERTEAAVASGTVVWLERRGARTSIGSYDIPSGATAAIVSTPGRKMTPSTDGTWVAWAEDRDTYGPRIWARRLAGGTSFPVAPGSAGSQTLPRVAGGYVVWQQQASFQASAPPAVFGAALSPRGTAKRLGSPALLPASDGRTVTWVEPRSGQLQVVALDVASGSRRFVTRGPGEHTAPAIGDGRILWVQRANGGALQAVAAPAASGNASPVAPAAGRDQPAVAAARGCVAWLERREDGWHVRARFARVPGEGAMTLTPWVAGSPEPGAGGREAGGSAARGSLGARLIRVQAAPAPPSSVSAIVENGSAVRVAWVAGTSSSPIVSYDVFRSATPIDATNIGALTPVATASGASVSIPAASGEASQAFTLYYAVRARDSAGLVSAPSVNVSPDPHGVAGISAPTFSCQVCHRLDPGSAEPGDRSSCYSCHGDTPATTAFGAGSPVDTQAGFHDDTASPLPSGGSQHRNQTMTDNVRDCDACHTPHRRPWSADPASRYTRLLRTQLASPSTSATYRYDTAASPVGDAFCFDCHGPDATPISIVGGPTAYTDAGGDHQTGWASSAHAALPAPDTDPGIQCLVCHDSHSSAAPRLLGRLDISSGSNLVSGTPVTANDNAVCYACHTLASPGFPAGSRTASGFPATGTWPGRASYETTYSASAHTGGFHSVTAVAWPGAGIPGGQCRNCHAIHGRSNAFDILRDTDVSGVHGAYAYTSSDFSFCFACHRAGGPSVNDIRRFYPAAGGGTNASSSAGHATVSGGALPAGSPLPCYDCHQPHGSPSAYGLLVVTQTAANTTITVGDTGGELAMSPGRSGTDVRHFCFTCHTTADTSGGWNGSAYATVTAGAKVEGIDRTSSAGGAVLRLPNVGGHGSADTQSCYDCHGSDYGSGGANVHAPGGGSSQGAVACYGCHTSFKETMDASGTARTSSYHHVLGTGGYTGDLAPGAGAYPTTLTPGAQPVYCVSCHTDHNYFNGDKGSNLRQGIGLPGSATASTDFSTASPYGICVSCHAVGFAKDNANQKAANASARTPAIAGSDYAVSSHGYGVPGAFGASTFTANCVKCHDDALPSPFQTGTSRFSLHYSAESRLLAAMATTVPASGATEEAFCYRCHSGTGTSDYYGVAAMSANAKGVLTAFSATYAHPIGSTTGVHRSDENLPTSPRHVECEDCHDPHAAKGGVHVQGSSAAGAALLGADGVVPSFGGSNFTSPTAFTVRTLTGKPTDFEAYVCFKCHTSYVPLPASGGSGGFGSTDLAVEFDPNNQSGHSVLGTQTVWPKTSFGTATWSAPSTASAYATFTAGLGNSYRLTCSECHSYDATGARGPHGSSSKFLLRAGGATDWYRTTLSGWSTGFLCGKCHLKGSNNVHNIGNHGSFTCDVCHVRIPHGWKRPRELVRLGTDSGAYVTTSTAGGLVAFKQKSYTPTGWTASDCQASCHNSPHGATISPAWP